MKYFITGGCGFLGSNLCAEVLKRKEELIVFDNLSRIGAKENLKWLKKQGRFKFFQSDIRKTRAVETVIKNTKPEVIFHLAAQVAMTTSIDNPRLDFETNALGTLNLLEAIRKHSPQSITVYSSTNKVYGDLERFHYIEKDTRYVCKEYPDGFNENIPLNFHSPYGCSKGVADQYMLDYCRMFNARTVVFRHSSIYGGRQFSAYNQGWIGWFCQKAIETKKGILKEPFTISGNGKQVRDILYVDDAIKLYFCAAENIAKIKGQVFNIGGGIKNSLSLIELFTSLESLLGIRLDYAKLPMRLSDQKVFVADINKITTMLGWHPKIDKIEGLKKMLRWIMEERG
ncbi:MAG: GDP-mannose 4,6-dehydratase [Candidatus Omnitrophica bacterium]|jgi:CDP-paratose 2-epimerase|nr:GDP-mannose 4,6-dehydratase [Candidatus Omnitrophota bacterium]